MLGARGIPCVGEDPKYQRVKQELREEDSSRLHQIVEEFKPRVEKREKITFLTSLVGVSLPLLGMMTAVGLDAVGLTYASKKAEECSKYLLLSAVPIVLSVAAYNGTGRRNREEYQSIAADVLLDEREKAK
jgi:hypothetical protein